MEETTPPEIVTEEPQEIYPGIIQRVKAIFVDSLVIVVFIAVASSVFSSFKDTPDSVRIGAFIFIFALYDPVFTSLFGATIGHMLIGIRVKRESDPTRNILFPLSIIRWGIKASLGWISLLTVTGNEKRRAIHDYATGSVVVYRKKN